MQNIIIEVYLLKIFLKATSYIYKWCHYRKTNFNQLDIIVFYVVIISPAIVSQLYEKSMWYGENVMWGGCTSISSAC